MNGGTLSWLWRLLLSERGEVGEPAAQETPPIEPPVTPPAPPEEPETPSEEPEGGEPGGKSGLEVARRKEYERRVAAEARAAALEEQLKAREERRSEKKRYTPEEVEDAITAGNISRAEGHAYLARVQAEEVLDEREKKKAAEEPVRRAETELREYKSYEPWIDDQSDERTRKIEADYKFLVEVRGFPAGPQTALTAIERQVGSLSKVKERHEVNKLSRANARPGPADAGAGGGGSGSANGKVDIGKAPATMVQSWDREGVDEATRERRYRIYLDLKARKSGR